MKFDKSIIGGSAYIGVTGAETDNGQCYDSIVQIHRRPDDVLNFVRATKGFEARQTHLNNFLDSKKDFLLMLDADMVFPAGVLERLRSHGLPYISGLYMRRTYAPIAPIWFQDGKPGQMPLRWWTGKIAENTIYKIGASGWGLVLIHRQVVEATRKILKGEPEIIEDDMDVYPYDLQRVTNSINRIWEMSKSDDIDTEALRAHAAILRTEIRPLRGLKTNVGSDVRFPFFAKLAGFQLYGDSGAQAAHMLNYPLRPTDFAGLMEDYHPAMTADLTKGATQAYNQERAKVQAALDGMK